MMEFEVEDGEAVIEDRLLSALRSAIGKRTASDCYEHKEDISKEIIEEVQDGLAELGFEIKQVPITEVSPHPDVVRSINEVQAAQRSTDVEKARAEGTTVRINTEAEAQAKAAKLRGQGRADELAAEAKGYLDMYRTVSGNDQAVLDPRAAVSLMMFFQNMGMKAAFAKSGRSSSVILPDDKDSISEIANLVPALKSHESIEDEDEDDDRPAAELEAELREKLSDEGEEAESLIESLKGEGSEAARAAIERLPRSVQWLGKKLLRKLRS